MSYAKLLSPLLLSSSSWHNSWCVQLLNSIFISLGNRIVFLGIGILFRDMLIFGVDKFI